MFRQETELNSARFQQGEQRLVLGDRGVEIRSRQKVQRPPLGTDRRIAAKGRRRGFEQYPAQTTDFRLAGEPRHLHLLPRRIKP